MESGNVCRWGCPFGCASAREHQRSEDILISAAASAPRWPGRCRKLRRNGGACAKDAQDQDQPGRRQRSKGPLEGSAALGILEVNARTRTSRAGASAPPLRSMPR